MPSIVIVEKNGDLKAQEYKSSTIDELYKKCSYKKADGFGKVAEWTYSKKGENMITMAKRIKKINMIFLHLQIVCFFLETAHFWRGIQI